MIVDNGHKQAFNINLSGVVRIHNPRNDFGGSH